MLVEIGTALVTGLGWGCFGYLSALKDGEKFDKKKFAKGAILGFIVGGAMVWTGLNPQSTYSWLSQVVSGAGLTALLDKLVTLIWISAEKYNKKK